MEATQDGYARCPRRAPKREGRDGVGMGDTLRNALVGTRSVEIRRVLPQHTPEVRLSEDQDVVEALAPDAAEKTLA